MKTQRISSTPMALVCALLLAGATTAHAGIVTVVAYDTTNPNGSTGAPSPDLDPAESVLDISAMKYARGPGLIPNQGITLNSSGWSTASSLDLNSDDYLSWGWNDGGGVYHLEDLTLQYDRSPSGPEQIAITLSINGNAQQIIHTDSFVDPSDETHTIDLTTFDHVASAEFRLYGFDSSATGTFDIERFTSDPDPSWGIQIQATAVPEPSAFSFILTAVAWPVVRRRRRRDS